MFVKAYKTLNVFLMLCLYSSITFSQTVKKNEKVYLKFDSSQFVPLAGLSMYENTVQKGGGKNEIRFKRFYGSTMLVDHFIFNMHNGTKKYITKKELSTLPISEFKHLEEVAKNKGYWDDPGKVYISIALIEITKDGKIILYDPVKWKRVVQIE